MSYIASITTYPKRFESFLKAIRSINNQTVRPELIVVNIANEDWVEAENKLFDRVPHVVPISFERTVNLRPANKLLPTAKRYNDTIITFDDDIIYPFDRVEALLYYHMLYPNLPISFRVRNVSFTGKDVDPYGKWKISQGDLGPDKLYFPTGVSGALYPNSIFDDEFLNLEKYVKLSKTNDDIWNYFQVHRQGKMFVQAGREVVPPSIPSAQKTALMSTNLSGGNDAIISALEKEYGLLYDLTNN